MHIKGGSPTKSENKSASCVRGYYYMTTRNPAGSLKKNTFWEIFVKLQDKYFGPIFETQNNQVCSKKTGGNYSTIIL